LEVFCDLCHLPAAAAAAAPEEVAAADEAAAALVGGRHRVPSKGDITRLW
jgi:hypothetical protein